MFFSGVGIFFFGGVLGFRYYGWEDVVGFVDRCFINLVSYVFSLELGGKREGERWLFGRVRVVLRYFYRCYVFGL